MSAARGTVIYSPLPRDCHNKGGWMLLFASDEDTINAQNRMGKPHSRRRPSSEECSSLPTLPSLLRLPKESQVPDPHSRAIRASSGLLCSG